MNAEFASCLEDCLDCHRTCLDHALNHCLEAGGAHVEPAHFRTMLDCAELCHTAARLMMSGSPHAIALCQLCAQVCSDCADQCAALGDMDDCVEACKRCAASCRQMAIS
ncbi:MAG: hypothetical protein AMXMBFR76_04920 [Pseudomonadota bacterium]|jgi:hypothetical protein